MFNFKKIASVLASAVMLSSTIGFAAAASYPTPFVESGTADVAVIWGGNAAISDLTAAIDLQSDLGDLVKFGGTETEPLISGEAAAGGLIPVMLAGISRYGYSTCESRIEVQI